MIVPSFSVYLPFVTIVTCRRAPRNDFRFQISIEDRLICRQTPCRYAHANVPYVAGILAKKRGPGVGKGGIVCPPILFRAFTDASACPDPNLCRAPSHVPRGGSVTSARPRRGRGTWREMDPRGERASPRPRPYLSGAREFSPRRHPLASRGLTLFHRLSAPEFHPSAQRRLVYLFRRE